MSNVKDDVSSYWNKHTASVNRRFVCSLFVNAHDFLYYGPSRGPVQLIEGKKRKEKKKKWTRMRSRLWRLLCSNYVVTLCSSQGKGWASGSAHFTTCVVTVYSSCSRSLVRQDNREVTIGEMGTGSHFFVKLNAYWTACFSPPSG